MLAGTIPASWGRQVGSLLGLASCVLGGILDVAGMAPKGACKALRCPALPHLSDSLLA